MGEAARAGGLGAAGTLLTGSLTCWLARGTGARWPGATTTVAVEDALAPLVLGAATLLAAWGTVLLVRATAALLAAATHRRAPAPGSRLVGRVVAGLLVVAATGAAPAAAAPLPPPVLAASPVRAASPVTATPVTPVTSTAATLVAAPALAASATGPEADEAPVPGWTPTVVGTAPDHATTGEVGLVSTAPTSGVPDTDRVVVRAGDTLWDIVARALGAQATDQDVAEEWPRWYTANRATIGDDPDLILPGQVLVAPSAEDDR